MARASHSLTGSTTLDEIVAVIGWDATMMLVRAFGGRRIDVPRSPASDHRIVRAIGAAAATKLADGFHGVRLAIPVKLWREMRVRELAKREPPLTAGDIAQEVGIAERTVFDILSRQAVPLRSQGPDDRDQMDMFDAA